MSVPAPRRKRFTPAEITSAWGFCFDMVLEELINRGLHPDKAKEVAAYVAATLVRETEVGNQSRDH